MATFGRKRCYYEILNVERNAGEEEIRKSYRKLALKLHPDKNQNSLESKEQFSELQAAFEVLMDKQERAWYDRHREAILLSGDSDYKNYQDNSINLLRFFTTSCYSGVGDNPTEFFPVYRNVFDVISQEDSLFREVADTEPPTFGDSTSDYDTVVYEFYAYWTSYSTPISYVWKEKWDTRDAPTRRVARAAEMDNVKLREQAKKERNERVRTLALFVRKRDPRVKAYEGKLDEKRRERGEKRRENRLEQKRHATRLFEGCVPSRENGLEDDSSSAESDLEALEENYCPACEKSFHSQKTFINHQKSSKHKENVAFLRKLLEGQEQTELSLSGEELAIEGLDQLELSQELAVDTAPKSSKKSKKKRRKNKPLPPHSGLSDSDSEQIDVADELMDVVPENPEVSADKATEVPQGDAVKINPAPVKKNKIQAKPQKIRIAPPQAAGGKSKSSPSNPETILCRVCRQQFATRNKLFRHIEATGHAIVKS